ncbi:Major capsid protein Gp5 [uncultured Caudovirales phage]|uniref:Major capsid protein Gp5 n=1 Tax=uncultured Caudovirales phage TaxID=2100421 RepID=A0A6J7X1T1_9CAUD|nr:Major capsid protein Gp5 [uncultured Caudovirales phage]CAB5224765.1 Major capsid protein Gp5 [uncultured Caudovirales phage]
MAYTDNVLKQVATLADANLGILQNSKPLTKYSNKKFQDFVSRTANLGDTVNIQKPFRMNYKNQTAADFSSAGAQVVVRWQPLTLDTPFESSWQVDTVQFAEYPFNDYKNGIGKSQMASIATGVENFLASQIPLHTFRSWANVNRSASSSAVITAPGSFGELSQIYQRMVSFGIPDASDARMFIANDSIPAIVNSGLAQFALQRNDKMAMSYDVGDFGGVSFHSSNMLQAHQSGTVGDANIPTTVTNLSSDGLTLTVATGNNATFKKNDIISIVLKGSSTFNYLKWTGYTPGTEIVQVRVTADVTASGTGDAALPIYPALIYDAAGNNTERNIPLDINATIAASGVFDVYCLPSHRCGVFMVSNPLYFASPKLCDLSPFATSVKTDADTGMSLRAAYGSTLDTKVTGYTVDIYTGATAIDEYMIRVCFPLQSSLGGYY